MLAPTEIRREMIRMIARSSGFHIAPNLSAIEILYTLYFRVLRLDPDRPDDPDRDRFVPSKGHNAASVYAVMAARGLLDPALLRTYNTDGSRLPPIVDSHSAARCEISSGSIGRGVSVGVGMALVAQREHRPYRVYVLIGDGECQEGSVWEGVMLAPALGLDNLTVVVDNNGLQGSSTIAEVMGVPDLRRRFEAFGWQAVEVDGHNVDALEAAFRAPQQGPKVVIADTIKGKGVRMMENEVGWHYRSLTMPELVNTLRELR
jgi:transketolase